MKNRRMSPLEGITKALRLSLGEIILDYPGGSSVITGVLIRGKQEDQRGVTVGAEVGVCVCVCECVCVREREI